jgi:hypothetical protein
MPTDDYGIVAMLARRVGQSADIEKVAAVAVAVWRDVDNALSPIIGDAGVAALYRRSLYSSLANHPCLAVAYENISPGGERFAELETALLQQTPEVASAALLALLTTFHELLTFLIGGSLFERLLRSVWNKPTNGDATKESE